MSNQTTGSGTTASIPTSSGTTNPVQPTSGTTQTLPDHSNAIAGLMGHYHTLDTRITKLEQLQKPEKKYFKSGTIINHTSILVFILLPIVQLCVTVLLLNKYLPNDNKLPQIFYIILGLIGLASVAELFYVPFKIYFLEKRLESIES